MSGTGDANGTNGTGKDGAPASPKDIQDKPIIQIYNKINDLFGGKQGQMFMMEFPGRILDMGTYQYEDSATDNAQQTKPQTIAEAEFRLTDDLFTLAELTGGPKGSKVSEIYSQAINQFIPAAASTDSYAQKILPDQLLITEWLLEPVPDWELPDEDILADLPEQFKSVIPPKKKAVVTTPPHLLSADGKPSTVPRVDLYQKLTDAYENERFRWEQFKLKARPTDDKDKKAWDLYNRTLAAFAPTIDKKLEGLWTTLIVRGQYHRVRHYVGLVDVETGSETLLKAKESLRSSVLRSIDDTQDIYPVQLSPASWASYLNTDFAPVDLLMNPALLREQLMDKQDQRQQLLVRLGQLKTAQQDISALQKTADDARKAFDKANNDMVKGFSDAAISLVQMYFQARGAKKGTELKDAEKGDINGVLTANNQPPLTDAQFQQLKDMQGKAIDNQSNFLNASEAVARSQAALAGGIASDPALAMAQVQGQIDSLTSAIETLKSILNSTTSITDTGYDPTTHAPLAAPKEPTLDGNLPPLPAPKTGASEWTSITATYDHSKETSDKTLNTSATHSSWSVSLFFGSGGQSSDESSSDKAENMTQEKTSIAVGFNVMKVEINRPWMDASVFAQTKDFYRMGSTPISPGPDFLKIVNNPDSTQSAIDTALADAEKALMPAYPVAFIVAKDVTMTLTNNFASSGDASSYIEKTSSSGGGILCFSISRSSHETHSTQSAYSEADSKHINIRIPGPQIIGWIVQTVPKDESTTDYTNIDKKQFDLDNPGGSDKPSPPTPPNHDS